MAKTKISEFNANPALNTDIDSINIAEGCAPSGINDAIRELMSQLKDWQAGTSNDPMVIGSSGSLTLNQGTANGVAYLNGSKVVTSGSALTFDGTNFGVGGSGDPFGRFYGRSIGLSSASSAFFELNAATGSTSGIDFGVNSSRTAGITSNTTETNFTTLGATPLLFGINGSEGMRLTSTGLGIGTSSPTDKLHVLGLARINTGTYSAGYGLTFQANSETSRTYQMGMVTGGAFAIYDSTAAAQRVVLDSSGNLGLGVTPSAWSSDTKAIQVSSVSVSSTGNSAQYMQNAYYNAGYKYIGTGNASLYEQNKFNGTHNWFIAPSGTAGNAITFTQALTLDANGNLLVGTTSATFGERLKVENSGGSQNVAFFKFSSTDDRTAVISQHNGSTGATSRKHYAFFNASTSETGSIAVTGSATSYNTSSDYRLKNTIAPMTGALAKVAQLKPCTYKWNSDGSDGEGFIAHELAEVVPQCVTGEKDAVDENGNPKYQGIDTSFLVATLTSAIQELKAEFDAYKASHP